MTLSVSEYEHLFRANYRRLYNTACRITNDKDSAKDIVQNVFLKLWDQRLSLDIKTSLEGYLFRSTTNASLDHLEKDKRLVRYADEVNFSLDSPADLPSQQISVKELEKLIERCILSLPPKCRAIFILSRYEGMRYTQIADHLSISVNTVENQMVKALAAMRNGLKPYLTKEFLILGISGGLSFLLHLLSVMLVITWLARLF